MLLKRYLTVLLLMALLPCRALRAQGESAMPFMLLQPSANQNAMAGAFTGLANTEAFCGFYNPALLGYFGSSYNFAVQQSRADWLPGFSFSETTVEDDGLQLGYNLEKFSLPLSVGLSLDQFKLNLGKNVWTDENGNVLGTYYSQEWYNALRFGLTYDWLVQTSIGIGYKHATSDLVYSRYGPVKRDADVWDWGIHVNVPLLRLILENHSGYDQKFKPFLDLGLGMVNENIGGEVIYIDKNQADPLPRQAKMGFSVAGGLHMKIIGLQMCAFKIFWSSEANDLLIKSNGLSKTYQTFPGDIDIFKNILRARGDEKVINRSGFGIDLLGTFQITAGRFAGFGYYNIGTEGYRLRSATLFRLLSGMVDNDSLRLLLDHVDFQYARSVYKGSKDNPLYDTKFDTLSLVVYGF